MNPNMGNICISLNFDYYYYFAWVPCKCTKHQTTLPTYIHFGFQLSGCLSSSGVLETIRKKNTKHMNAFTMFTASTLQFMHFILYFIPNAVQRMKKDASANISIATNFNLYIVQHVWMLHEFNESVGILKRATFVFIS